MQLKIIIIQFNDPLEQHSNWKQLFAEICSCADSAKLNADFTWLKWTPYKFNTIQIHMLLTEIE